MTSTAPLVLIAEDEDHLRLLAATLLEEAGYRVEATANGKECVEAYRRLGPDLVALVVLDFRMPEMNGIQAFRLLRSINPRVRILINSASIEPEQLNELIKLGAVGAIPKPYTKEEFLEKVQASL